ncbi:MAG: hypothetical protein ACREHC_04345 [Candidatus Levyibacteriota bacterium]
MNFAALAPRPIIPMMSRPVKVTPKGNVYKIAVSRYDTEGNKAPNHEIWMTKEAIQQHFSDMKTDPENYQIKQFARHTYQKALRSGNGALKHNGLLVTTEGIAHGDTKLWPHTISHPEVKF